jgi:sigma-E factor negative regulatory protein RseC
MATEEGIVVRSDAFGTWVRAQKTGACESCASRGSCHSLGGGDDQEVSVLNPIGARIGDRVLIRMESSALLKASFLIYLFPVLMLMLGAGLGEWISQASRLETSLPAAIAGFGSLAAGLFIMKIVANRIARRPDYQPRIVRVIRVPEPHR